ncbi:MAG: DUF3944 domain-containing protein [Desulfobacteraceae bacterium]|jgi:hypothetical protein
MNKKKLIEIIQGILKTDADLSFLKKLKESELETLVACIRERIDQVGT